MAVWKRSCIPVTQSSSGHKKIRRTSESKGRRNDFGTQSNATRSALRLMMEVTRSGDRDSKRRAAASLSILNLSILLSNFLSSTSAAAVVAGSPTYANERAALQSISANAWLNKTDRPDPCINAWQGVTCDGGTPLQHVVEINLNSTSGIMSAEFFAGVGRLPRLKSLSLANCSLTGILSDLAGSSSSLSPIQYLDLSSNSFTGEIPPKFGNFPSLKSLSLAQNQLRGQVPEDICRAASITVLVLGGNQLEGPVPSCVGNLSTLSVLNISDNDLNGTLPESLGELKALTELDLSLNSLTGPLPASLTGLSNLTKLHLSGNFLDGALPVDIDRMSKLQELYLDSNQFSGPIPVSICSVGSLQKLRLFDNQLTGSILECLGNLTQLTVLFLHANQLAGPLPESLGNLTLLQELQVQGNRLNGTLPENIWPRLTNLQSFYAHFNELEGEIPLQMLLVASWTNISLGFNKFTGSLPNPQNTPGTPPMANLKFLSICNNSLTGPIPLDVSRLGNLEFLDLSNNQLNGSIPSQLASIINYNRVQANLIFNDFDQRSWMTIRGSGACSQLLNVSLDQQCLGVGLSKGLGINVGGPLVTSEVSGQVFVADDSFTSLLGSYEYSLDNNSGTTPWVMSEQGAVQESGTSIITSSASPPALPIGFTLPSQWMQAGIQDWIIFQSARVGGDTLSYRIGNLTPGDYVVDLFFAELDILVNRPGQRVFSIYIQGELRMASLDIFNLTGSTMKPIIVSFPISISHGVIDVRLVGRGSWPATQEQMRVYRGPILSALVARHDTQKAEVSLYRKVALIVAAVVGGSLLGLAVLSASGSVCRRRRRARLIASAWNSVGLVSFKYAELEAATNKFSERNLLGQGAFGRVFKGVLPQGAFIAIKQLSIPNPSSLESLQNELLVISTVRHRNLVPLIGCCLEKESPIIVCRFMPKGNLHDALFMQSSLALLSWSARHKIALDVARGLHYLHEGSVQTIVHRDVKPANILLDDKLTAYIADFGMARLLEEQENEIITCARGTRGYMAPEYAMNGQLSDKVDVFSFGVVVLELVIGRRGMQSAVASPEQVPLCQWAWQMFSAGEFEEMMDKRLGKDYVRSEAMTMLQVAIWCTDYDQSMRPSMSQVLHMLSNQAAVPPLPERKKGYGEQLKDAYTPFDGHYWEQYISSSHGDQVPTSLVELEDSRSLQGSRSRNYSGSDMSSLDGR